MFEMDFKHWPNSQCLLPSISKWLFGKISIYHIMLKVNTLKKSQILWDENYQTFHMVQKHGSKYVQSHVCEIYITNFMKVKNHFNHLWSIFAFFNTQLQVYFLYKYFNLYNIHSKQFFSFLFYYLGYILPYYVKTLWNFLLMLTWFKFKNTHLRKQYNVTTQKGSP
jgi:hypothetical protein